MPKHRNKQFDFRLHKLNISKDIHFEILDLTSYTNTNYLLEKYKPKYLAHLASQSSVVKGITHIELTKQDELITENLINSLIFYSKETKIFFPSSATIYEGYENMKVNEETTPKPLSIYAKTKNNTHQKLKKLIKQKTLLGNIGIMFSHESEFRRPNYFSKTVVEFLCSYKQNPTKTLNVGNIYIQRDIGYAEEYVDAIFRLTESSKNDEFIISSNKLVSLKEFIDNCLNILEINYEIIEEKEKVSFIDTASGKVFIKTNPAMFRKIDLHGIRGDNTKITTEIGWVPTYNLEQICSKMISYELRNST